MINSGEGGDTIPETCIISHNGSEWRQVVDTKLLEHHQKYFIKWDFIF